MMRIITGRARGTRLYTLEGEMTRPTAERTKEAVFSMLQFQLADAEVLDLFAGSGQLGLEAVSRGAARAILCDRARDAMEIVKKNIQKTGLDAFCETLCADYQMALRALAGRRFDIVFLDPPYAIGAVPTALKQMLEGALLADSAIVVCETAAEEDVFSGDADLERAFEIQRRTRYGAACVTVLKKAEKETERV